MDGKVIKFDIGNGLELNVSKSKGSVNLSVHHLLVMQICK